LLSPFYKNQITHIFELKNGNACLKKSTISNLFYLHTQMCLQILIHYSESTVQVTTLQAQNHISRKQLNYQGSDIYIKKKEYIQP